MGYPVPSTDGGNCMKVVVYKSPKFLGGILKMLFGFKKDK
ncbi:MAG: stage V sporulation protein SpoVM [Clostridia bacterium]|nr:stage V sporulation protein SpoVM [Clostridia bacterium]